MQGLIGFAEMMLLSDAGKDAIAMVEADVLVGAAAAMGVMEFML